MAQHRVTIVGKDYEAMAALTRDHGVAVVRRTARELADGRCQVQAHVEAGRVAKLVQAGYAVTLHEDVDALGAERQEQARAAREGRKAGQPAPGYLDVDEIEAALAKTVQENAGLARLIELPKKTWEGRTCHAARIGAVNGGVGRPAIFLLGGVHAREWGSPDILVSFLELVLAAYRDGQPITLGHKTFHAADVRSVVTDKVLYVFPQANPDGRHHSMTRAPMWRKNRRPAPDGHPNPHCIGVDINRNYDFLWDFKKYFDPRAPVANSTNPCEFEVYVGPHPHSEPETQNVVWLLEHDRDIRYLVDIHSYGQDILYSWGDDRNQTTLLDMNFRNPEYDGKRGRVRDKAYLEFIPADDAKHARSLAEHMARAIEAVRGRVYKTEQSVGMYPAAGESDDYAYSRHFVDPARPKTYGFTVEWGSEETDANPTPFHPPYQEMTRIIDDVTAGLLEFCIKAG